MTDRLRVLFIHGLEGSPQGAKARFLAQHFECTTPAMDTSDFAACVETQAQALAAFRPDVVVGSSFGGAVAVALLDRAAWRGPTLLLAQAALKLGSVHRLPRDVPVLLVHGSRDDVVPVADSRALADTGSADLVRLLEVDDDHRLQTLIDGGALAELVREAAALGRPGRWSQDAYQRAIAFAARAHGEQRVPGSGLPYVVHLSNVAMEVIAAARIDAFDAELALTCALLHDTLEDTEVSEADLEQAFGARVARGVRALTKDGALAKEQRMGDALARIAQQPREIAIVKLADRITNLQAPPADWSQPKRAAYQREAREILAALGASCAPLATRLAAKIEAYSAFIERDADPQTG